MPRRQISFNCCQVNEQPVQAFVSPAWQYKTCAKDPARRSSEGVDEQPTPPKQAKLFSSVGAQKQVTQKDINRLVAGFIVEDMLPVSTIESPMVSKNTR